MAVASTSPGLEVTGQRLQPDRAGAEWWLGGQPAEAGLVASAMVGRNLPRPGCGVFTARSAPSMGATGIWDNAGAESSWPTFKH